jgi:hypothetical protein
MALSATEEAINDATNVLMTAWENHLETLTTGDKVFVIVGNAYHTDGFQDGYVDEAVAAVPTGLGLAMFNPENAIPLTIIDVTAQAPIPTKIGPYPLFHKVTNAAKETET